MLEIFHSNKLETLLEYLEKATSLPPDDPFQSEAVVVQNLGMARWIDQQLAEHRGISALIDYPLPAVFFWQVLKAWIPGAPDSSLFEEEALSWRVLELLPEQLEHGSFAPLKRYLQAENPELRLFQLSRRIADLFDQYLVFRPEMVLAWERGGEEHWQARLWRALNAGGETAHRARLYSDLEQAMIAGEPVPGGVPERVSLFGLTALAPVYVRMLQALGNFIQVNVFYLNPSRHYWADLEDERGQSRRRARARKAGLPDPTGLLDVGNPLLASMGHAGQVFLDQLLETGGTDHDLFVQTEGGTLLHQVQRDILDLGDSRKQSGDMTLAEGDFSIQVHCAHSRLREVQILHDRLLRMFEQIEGLEPRDVIVMAPDVDQYAPCVEALFGAPSPAMGIPWSIADSRQVSDQPLLKGIEQLLSLPRSRFEVGELLSFLDLPAVRRRFGLDEAGVEKIRTWVRESGIRWGRDEKMRIELGLPSERANSWAFGLDRLFLGYAFPPDPDADTYAGVQPYIDVEGTEVSCLGMLESFLEVIDSWRTRLITPRSLGDWCTAFNEMLVALMAPNEEEELLLQGLRDQLDRLVTSSCEAGFEGPLALDVFRSLLSAQFDDTRGAQRFLTGRVSFCNMVPMRSIPFRVVCLIGMNGDDFPRNQPPLSFDLMAQSPKRGDRSRRRDDRYLFLEAILSARDALYISYVGNDIHDNSIKIPSVVTSELLDYLRQSIRCEQTGEVEEQLLIRHPLQPFSHRYFDGSDKRLFSYAQAWKEAAFSESGGAIPPFVPGDAGLPEDALKTLDIEELIYFFRNPANSFLTRRLGLSLLDMEAVPEDIEPFDSTGLERYQLRQTLLEQRLRGRGTPVILSRLRGEGVLPHGAPGDRIFEEQAAEVDPFIARLERYQHESLAPLNVDIALGDFRIQGQLRHRQHSGLTNYRFGKLKCRDRLAAWIRHLILNVLAPNDSGRESCFVAEDCTMKLQPVDNPAELLQDLLEMRWRGLQLPLPFFPESSLGWYIHETYGSEFEHAWAGMNNPMPESCDSGVRIAFRGLNPLGDAFEDSARSILKPLLDHTHTLSAKKDHP
ncbi:MAG: exodeoxyribonuclease V subunit gamma [Gammaproteobacteria bacterium]|nr:exodeoxyribonuclease V subunit gamma [Gammaproteobacteria bacterium]